MKAPTENKIRVTAFLVLLITLIFIKTGFIILPIFLALDFALRGFGYGKYSILAKFASALSSFLKLPEKPVFFPPKQFAAKVGFLFSICIIAFSLMRWDMAAAVFAIILSICAGLEAFFNFCAGCYIYNLYFRLKYKFNF